MAKELLKADEIRGWSKEKLREAELEIRRSLVESRLDVYQAASLKIGQVRTLRKNLARILTVRNQGRTKQVKERAK